MSETKKRVYKRETCTETIKGLVQRAVDVNEDKADYHYYNKIKDLILFGSYVNTDKDRIHDVDICLISDRDYEESQRFVDDNWDDVSWKFSDMWSRIFAEHILQVRYLKGRRNMFSVHSNIGEGNDIIDIATSDKHIVIISDHQLTEEGRLLLEGKLAS